MWRLKPISTRDFVAELQRALGPRLKSAVLYGSAVGGDFDPDSSDVNLLLVIEPLTLAELETIAPFAARWRGPRKRAPQLFTPEQIACSLDAFAIEWHDIHQVRRILAGDDPFTEFRIPLEPLRLQLEHELNAIVLGLREGFLKLNGSLRRLRRMLERSVVPLLVLCRGALRLIPDIGEVPTVKLEALELLASRMNFEPDPIARVLLMRQRELKVPDHELPKLFGEYLRSTEMLLAAIDQTLLHHTHAGEAHP